LAEEGFTVEWEKAKDGYRFHEITCPYYQIGQNHPKVCIVDQTLISKMLAVPANKAQCILDGNSHCAYESTAKTFSKHEGHKGNKGNSRTL
jgi:predicted ArsR family transcriptional regulator